MDAAHHQQRGGDARDADAHHEAHDRRRLGQEYGQCERHEHEARRHQDEGAQVVGDGAPVVEMQAMDHGDGRLHDGPDEDGQGDEEGDERDGGGQQGEKA